MGSPATVPVFSPDGALGDIPQTQLVAAVKAGAKPGVHVTSPDGKDGVVPADRLKDAVSAGAKIVPLEDQPIQHPGFWASLGADLGGMAKGLWHGAVDPLTDTHKDLVRKLHEEQAADFAAENSSERKAHGALYRNVGVPAAEAVGVNVPGMEQSAAEGDVAGVAGHAAAPVAAAAITQGALRGIKLAPDVVEAVGERMQAGLKSPVGKFAGQLIDLASFDRVGKLYAAYKSMRAAMGPRPTFPGAPLPDVPAPELLQGNALLSGGRAPAPEPADALGRIAVRPQQQTPPRVLIDSKDLANHIAGKVDYTGQTPATFSGEGVLNQVLGGRDNATLLKIARSRGINVSKEAALKPGVGNKLIIGKIIDDFSPEELQEVRDQAIENGRFRHVFGEIGEEAWNTMALQTYFPDLKIPAAILRRTQASIAAAAKAAATPAAPAADAGGATLEDPLTRMLTQVKAGKKLSDLAAAR